MDYTGTRYKQPVSERNPFEVEWLTPSAADLAKGTPLRQAVEDTLEAWHPNYEEGGRITSYDDWIERLEGLDVPGLPGVRLDLGSDYGEDPWKTLKKIAKAVAADLR